MDRTSWLILSVCLLMTAGLAGCGNESAHSAAAPIPSTRSKHLSRLAPPRITPVTTHPSVSPQPKQSPTNTTASHTVAISLEPVANFPEIDQHVLQTLQPLTSVPLIAPTMLPSGTTDAQVITTPHGYDITWYNEMAAPAMNGSDTIADQNSLSNVPMVAYIGGYSYALYSTNQQAAQALHTVEESAHQLPNTHGIAIRLASGPEVTLDSKTFSATWMQDGWYCNASDEAFDSTTMILKIANQVATIVQGLHTYPVTTQNGYISQSLLPTMQPVTLTWVNGRALFSVGLDQGTLQEVWDSALSLAYLAPH